MNKFDTRVEKVFGGRVKSSKLRKSYWLAAGKFKKIDYEFRSLRYIKQRNLRFSKLLSYSHNITYRGVTCRKFPTDYLAIQMLIWEIKPDLIIEVGTNQGGSALLFSDLLSKSGKNFKINTIDIEDSVSSELVIQDSNIIRYLNGYSNYKITETANYENIMVIDVGSHQYSDVIDVMEKFKDIVSIGSYFVIEDGGLNYVGWKKNYAGGPSRAIDEFLTRNKNFEIDLKYSDLFGPNSTNNPKGYLRRMY